MITFTAVMMPNNEKAVRIDGLDSQPIFVKPILSKSGTLPNEGDAVIDRMVGGYTIQLDDQGIEIPDPTGTTESGFIEGPRHNYTFHGGGVINEVSDWEAEVKKLRSKLLTLFVSDYGNKKEITNVDQNLADYQTKDGETIQ